MDGEKKRGWWALAGVGVLTLLAGGYVGAYFALVEPKGIRWFGPPKAVVAVYPECKWLNLESFFWPINQIDREWVRPQTWEMTL